MRPLTHSAHRKFVEIEGWAKKGTAQGKKKTGDHHRYTLTLATGEVLRTRVSHGTGELGDPKVVAAVLRDQLQVSEAHFWACVEKGTKPPRPSAEVETPPGEVLDAKLARNLLRKVGLSQEELASLSKREAVGRWGRYLAEGGS